MSELGQYTEAVARRKMIVRDKGVSPKLNFVVCSQLEEDDIPRLLEIIRIQSSFITDVLEMEEHGEPPSVAVIYARVEAIAAEGSKKQWGTNGN